MRARSLSMRYAETVLRLMLSSGGEVKFSDLKSIVVNYPTLEKLMAALEEDGLVEIWRTLSPYKTNHARLTPLGARVARKLQDIEDMIAGGAAEGDEERL